MNKSSKDSASRLGHSTFEDRTLDRLGSALYVVPSTAISVKRKGGIMN
jgi:hypothetical protein